MRDAYQQLLDYWSLSPMASAVLALAVLALIALAVNFAVKHILVRVINRLLRMTPFGRDEELMRPGVIPRLANIVPAIILIMGAKTIPDLPDALRSIVVNVAGAFIVLTLARAISALLDVINTIYMRRSASANKPIKGYLQVLKIALAVVASILIIATLIDKSPVILLSGLGAMAAVLMLVFQDTLLSLVASIQISSSDMVRVGDWIEMPNLNADGDVIDIALHTVKVQNWDKTITTLPTRRLISDPFKNWRGMHESGGRRIKRAIALDQSSIHFLTEEEKAHIAKFRLLSGYLEAKDKEIRDWNASQGDGIGNTVNSRRTTNIGTFRAYVEAYLRSKPGVNQSMTLLVRQLAPTAEGLPLEIYCFSADTRWAVYEGLQADIFDHLYAILPEFGLRAFQAPGGHDMQMLRPAAG